MRLGGRTVALLLAEDGRQILASLSIDLPVEGLLVAEVRESEDLGLWIQIIRRGLPHLILMRWEYILTIDLPDQPEGQMFGLKGV